MAKIVFSLTFAFLVLATTFAQGRYELIIRNGRIVDGSGNPWYAADIGIRNGRVAAIGRLDPAQGARVLDAGGRIVAPGFIDVHTHAEEGVRRRPNAENFIFDGVTAIVTGNCGGSETDLAVFFSELRQSGTSINVATLIGHNSVRRAVMGSQERDPTPEEQARMEQLVEQAMRQGAVGFSTGLIYVPGTYSKTAEVVGLARAASKHHGVYASHIRNEGARVLEAISEAVQVGREAGMPVEISHFKVSGKPQWGHSAKTIELVERSRAAGVDVTVDQYPYTASSTNLGVLLPSWALAGGEEKIKERLADPAVRKRIADETKNEVKKRGGQKHLDFAVVARYRPDPSFEGKSIAQITRQLGRKRKIEHEVETVLEMMANGGAGMVYHTMHEDDVERIMRVPYSMVASDAGVIAFGDGTPHPRGYGTNARVLGRYVRERKVLTLEEAIRKMTSLPAQRFQLAERGLIKPGMWADLVIFDDSRVADRATFEKPHAYSEGFQYVLVNGVVVLEAGTHTGARPGQVLLGPGKGE